MLPMLDIAEDAAPVVVFVCGLNGTGKSTLARALRRELVAVDTTLIEDAVERGQNVVVDAVLADDVREQWIPEAREAGARVVIVECLCSDADLHRRRVEERLTRGESSITWQDTVRNRQIYAPHPAPHVIADAVLPVEDNLAKVLAALRP